MLPSALAFLTEIQQSIARAEPAVFLDYDGTLTPIVPRPDRALLSSAMRETVRRLGRLCPVAVVSGRDRSDIERLVGIDSIIYAGSHGFDIAGPAGLTMQHEGGGRLASSFQRATRALHQRIDGVAGVLIEPKRYAVAVHYRLVSDEQAPLVREAVDRTAADFPELRVTGGKKLLELRPRIDWDKGKAVLWLLDALGQGRDDLVPIYLGDDATDEDAFRAIQAKGIGIIIGDPPAESLARYCLADVSEVERFLNALVASINAPGRSNAS